MSPRRYSMKGRAAMAQTTRQAILDAATALYREQGIAATSLRQVAERADVARATVLNHFGTTEALAEAVVRRITAELDVPTARIFAGVDAPEERIRRLVDAMFAFYDRSAGWFAIFRGEIASVPALRQGEERFWRSIRPLYAAALSPRDGDRRLRATVRGLTHPATLGALRDSGLSRRQAAEVVGDVLAALVGGSRDRARR